MPAGKLSRRPSAIIILPPCRMQHLPVVDEALQLREFVSHVGQLASHVGNLLSQLAVFPLQAREHKHRLTLPLSGYHLFIIRSAYVCDASGVEKSSLFVKVSMLCLNTSFFARENTRHSFQPVFHAPSTLTPKPSLFTVSFCLVAP